MGRDSIEERLERQLRRWQIDRGAGMPRPRGAVVSISQMPASGGEEVARQVAAWLDYGLFDLESIRRIAADERLRARLATELAPADVEAIERRARRILPEAEEGLPDLARVIATLGERGMAVVVGRGATALLPPERTLRVLVVAGENFRRERLARAQGLAADAAAEALAREDAARRAFLSRLGIDGDDPRLYDLTLNAERLARDTAAALVVEALRRHVPPPGRSPGRGGAA